MNYKKLYALSFIMALITYGYLALLMWDSALMEYLLMVILILILSVFENEAGKQYIRERSE